MRALEKSAEVVVAKKPGRAVERRTEGVVPALWRTRQWRRSEDGSRGEILWPWSGRPKGGTRQAGRAEIESRWRRRPGKKGEVRVADGIRWSRRTTTGAALLSATGGAGDGRHEDHRTGGTPSEALAANPWQVAGRDLRGDPSEAGGNPETERWGPLLGIPTVLDRFIQQLLLQELGRIFEPGFSEHSYGFRPGRSNAGVRG